MLFEISSQTVCVVTCEINKITDCDMMIRSLADSNKCLPKSREITLKNYPPENLKSHIRKILPVRKILTLNYNLEEGQIRVHSRLACYVSFLLVNTGYYEV